MARLAFIIHFFVSTTLAGTFVIAVLVMGWDTWKPIVAAGALGYTLGFPAAVLIAKAMIAGSQPRD